MRISAAGAWKAAHDLAASDRLRDLLAAANLPGLEAHFKALFAAIPYNWHTRNEVARFEGYWASVMYSHFAALGVELTAEEASSAGRVDLALRAYGRVYLFELKVVERAGEGAALAQLIERGYAEKYRASGEPVHLVGVEFSAEQRRLERFETAAADAETP